MSVKHGRVTVSGEEGAEIISILLGPERDSGEPVIFTMRVRSGFMDLVCSHGLFGAMGPDMITISPKVVTRETAE